MNMVMVMIVVMDTVDMIMAVMTVIGMAVFGDGAVGVKHTTVLQMGVIVMMLVDRELRCASLDQAFCTE